MKKKLLLATSLVLTVIALFTTGCSVSGGKISIGAVVNIDSSTTKAEGTTSDTSPSDVTATLKCKWEKLGLSKEAIEKFITLVDGKEFNSGDTVDLSSIPGLTNGNTGNLDKLFSMAFGDYSYSESTKTISIKSYSKCTISSDFNTDSNIVFDKVTRD